MLQEHGGYEITAVADYFEQVANAAGEQFNVPKANRFAGLSGYQGLLAAGVEAVFLETPPYCFPEHVEAAVEAYRRAVASGDAKAIAAAEEAMIQRSAISTADSTLALSRAWPDRAGSTAVS